MLQYISNLPRSVGEPRPTVSDDRLQVEGSRLNPWLRWRPKRPARVHVLSVAELSECTCPDLCNRDHANE
jgi:hypothetical protein